MIYTVKRQGRNGIELVDVDAYSGDEAVTAAFSPGCSVVGVWPAEHSGGDEADEADGVDQVKRGPGRPRK